MSLPGAILIWMVIGSFYAVFFLSLYLAVNLRVDTRTKVLYCFGLTLVQPVGSLLFIFWYYSKFRTLKRL